MTTRVSRKIAVTERTLTAHVNVLGVYALVMHRCLGGSNFSRFDWLIVRQPHARLRLSLQYVVFCQYMVQSQVGIYEPSLPPQGFVYDR